MAIQDINVGLIANDGTGDDLREAFIKINNNFDELSALSTITAENVGTYGQGVLQGVENNNLTFFKLGVHPDYMDTMSIEYDATRDMILFFAKSARQRYTDGTLTMNIPADKIATLNGTQGTDITLFTDAPNNLYQINIDSQIFRETNPRLSTDLDINGHNINNVENINGSPIADLTSILEFDFGNLSNEVTSIIEWFNRSVDVDFGTLDTPETLTVDGGGLL
jgi:hypothetical protein